MFDPPRGQRRSRAKARNARLITNNIGRITVTQTEWDAITYPYIRGETSNIETYSALKNTHAAFEQFAVLHGITHSKLLCRAIYFTIAHNVEVLEWTRKIPWRTTTRIADVVASRGSTRGDHMHSSTLTFPHEAHWEYLFKPFSAILRKHLETAFPVKIGKVRHGGPVARSSIPFTITLLETMVVGKVFRDKLLDPQWDSVANKFDIAIRGAAVDGLK
jgi:hypothetical protein